MLGVIRRVQSTGGAELTLTYYRPATDRPSCVSEAELGRAQHGQVEPSDRRVGGLVYRECLREPDVQTCSVLRQAVTHTHTYTQLTSLILRPTTTAASSHRSDRRSKTQTSK